MRLSDDEIRAIEQAAKEAFPPGTGIYLFGSRLDDQARGGDIDLLVEPQTAWPMRNRLNRLEKLGFLDVTQWLAWREVRNRLAHEYPDQPEIRFAALLAAIDASKSLAELYRR